jgi:hypothetical protein
MCIGLDINYFRHTNQVVLFGGFSDLNEDLEQSKDFRAIDITNNCEIKKEMGKLKKGDFFYFNHYTVDRWGKQLVALGKEHIHFIDLQTYSCLSIREGDGDYPSIN